MDALTRASAKEIQIESETPSLQTLAVGIDRALARQGEPETEVSAWLKQRWSISAMKANNSASHNGPVLDADAVAFGFRRYRGSAADMMGAAAELRQEDAPASDREIAGMLATMNAALVQSRQSESETRLRLAAYVDRLRDYPQDVVSTALRQWPDKNRFWPAWAELRVELERIARPRRALIAELEMAAVTLEPERRKSLPGLALKRIPV